MCVRICGCACTLYRDAYHIRAGFSLRFCCTLFVFFLFVIVIVVFFFFFFAIRRCRCRCWRYRLSIQRQIRMCSLCAAQSPLLTVLGREKQWAKSRKGMKINKTTKFMYQHCIRYFHSTSGYLCMCVSVLAVYVLVRSREVHLKRTP